MALVPGLEGVNWFSVLGQVGNWLKWGFYGFIMIAGMGVVYILTTYNIKVSEISLTGGGKEGTFSVGKKRFNRFCWNKDKTAWKPLLPPMNKIKIQPFKPEYVYTGKQVYVFKVGKEFIPGRIEISEQSGTLGAKVTPIPHHIREWQSLGHRKNAIEYASHDFWTDNKIVIISLIAGLIILAAVVATVYIVMNSVGVHRDEVSALTQAIKGFSPSGAPPG